MIIKNLTRINEENKSKLILKEEYPFGSLITSIVLLVLLVIFLLFDYLLGFGATDSITSLIQILFFLPVVVFFLFLVLVVFSALYRTSLVITKTELIVQQYFLIIPVKKIYFQKEGFTIHFYDKRVVSPAISIEKQFNYLISLIRGSERIIIKYFRNNPTQLDKSYLLLLNTYNIPFHESTTRWLQQ